MKGHRDVGTGNDHPAKTMVTKWRVVFDVPKFVEELRFLPMSCHREAMIYNQSNSCSTVHDEWEANRWTLSSPMVRKAGN